MRLNLNIFFDILSLHNFYEIFFLHFFKMLRVFEISILQNFLNKWVFLCIIWFTSCIISNNNSRAVVTWPTFFSLLINFQLIHLVLQLGVRCTTRIEYHASWYSMTHYSRWHSWKVRMGVESSPCYHWASLYVIDYY